MNIDRPQEYGVTASVINGVYTAYTPKKRKKDMDFIQALKLDTQRVLREEWLNRIGGKSTASVYASVNSNMDRQRIEIGLPSMKCIEDTHYTMSYEAYVTQLANSMGRLEMLLDQILNNDQLFC